MGSRGGGDVESSDVDLAIGDFGAELGQLANVDGIGVGTVSACETTEGEGEERE